MKKTLQLTIFMSLIAMLSVGNLSAQKEKVRNPSFTNIKQSTITSNEAFVNDRGDGSPTYMLQNSTNGSTIHKGTVANPYMPSSGSIGTNVQCMEYIDGVLYGVNYGSGANNFGKIDTETGTWTTIKSNFASDGIALCWNPVDDNVYVAPWTGQDPLGTIFGKVDLATGNVTTIADFGPSGETFFMAIDNDGIAYAVDLQEEAFGTVDLTNGNFNPISYIDWDVNYISNMSIDRETNEIYWAARGDGLDHSGSGDLYSAYFNINKATGEMTLVYEDFNNILPQSFSIMNAPIGICDPATNLAVNYTNDCKAELTWDAPADNANAKYNIYRDNEPIKQNHDQKSYTDEGFITTEGHTWSIKAVCQDGGLSEEVSKSLSFCKCAPVINLSAKYNENCTAAELTWTAPAEGLKYNVYRGDDIIATEISTTTYIDETFENTGHTWKVKTICTDDVADDATVTLPICVGINQNELTFSIVPNPAQNEIVISSERNYNTIEVINFLGQTVISQPATAQKTTVDVSQLMGGVYFVRIVSDNGTNVQKFVKK